MDGTEKTGSRSGRGPEVPGGAVGKSAYESPRVVRLKVTGEAAGYCYPAGSGEGVCEGPGSGAGPTCWQGPYALTECRDGAMAESDCAVGDSHV